MKKKKDTLENLFGQYNKIGQEKAKSIKGGGLTGDTKSWECVEAWLANDTQYFTVDDCETAPDAAAYVGNRQYA